MRTIVTEQRSLCMHPWSFRAQLVFSIGFALSRSRELLRRSFENTPLMTPGASSRSGWSRSLEGSGFELDEQARALRQRPPTPPHSTPN